jgi:hypothetical protein
MAVTLTQKGLSVVPGDKAQSKFTLALDTSYPNPAGYVLTPGIVRLGENSQDRQHRSRDARRRCDVGVLDRRNARCRQQHRVDGAALGRREHGRRSRERGERLDRQLLDRARRQLTHSPNTEESRRTRCAFCVLREKQ